MKQEKSLFLNWKLPYIAIAGAIFALVAIFSRGAPEAKTPVVNPPKAEYSESVAGIGVIEPKSEIINIGVELAGVVREIPVKVGDMVKKDDVLFTIDQRDIDAQIAMLEQSLEVAKVQEADANAQFEIVAGIQDKRAVAKDEFNRRKFGKSLAEARTKEIAAKLNQAVTTKERLSVKAPIDGKILEVNIRPGEFASTGFLPQPLMRIGDVSTLRVRVEIDEQNAPHVKRRNPAKGFVRGNTNTSVPLIFVRFEPYIKPKQNLAVSGQRVDTRVMQIIYSLPENGKQLFVGGQMDVFIDTEKSDEE